MKRIGTEEHFVTDELVAAWSRLDPEVDGMRTGVHPGEVGERRKEVGERRIATPAPDAEELERAVTKLGLRAGCCSGVSASANWTIPTIGRSLRPLPPSGLRSIYIRSYLRQRCGRRSTRALTRPSVMGSRPLDSLGITSAGCNSCAWRSLACSTVSRTCGSSLDTWGEVMLSFLERSDQLARRAKLGRSFGEYVRHNAYITAGGVCGHHYIRWAIEVVGIERVMFASDHPCQSGPEGGVQHFMERAGLDPAEQQMVASGNWDRLIAEIQRSGTVE